METMDEKNRRSLRMHCIRLSVEKVKQGKYEEAIRLLKIIERQKCEGTKDVKDFINDLECVVRRKSILPSNQFTDNMHSIFMESQFLLVQEVLRQKNFYSILNVQKDATEGEIRKSYKRLLLQLHPDKNCSPDAALAFQLVTKAFTVLSDINKRQKYDEAGAYGTRFDAWDEDMTTIHQPMYSNNKKQQQQQKHHHNSCIQNILNALFNGESSMSKAMSDYRGNGAKTLLGSILVAVFLVFSISLLTRSNQLYSFTETSKFNVRQVTHRLRIPYYVEADFLKTYKRDVAKFEQDIETQFVTFANEMCKNERRERDNAMIRASQSGNRLEYARIFSVRLKSCDILVRLGLLYPNRTQETRNS